ncbi:MAG: TrmB family transcriptional regulator [Candidatus Diapherotrites archaeon]|nr:TrmB family transcriptional regulator [Candidatus Diapherotrites archaeon]
MSFEELNAFLAEFGLTEYETRVLSMLFGSGETQAPEISRQAQVPKTRVYDVLERLTKKGLLIEVSGRPKKYKALEPGKALDILLEESRARLKGLEEQAVLIKAHLEAPPEKKGSERVLKVREKNDFYRILVQEIDSAKKSVNGFSSGVATNPLLADAVKKAGARSVEVRIISAINKIKGKAGLEEGGVEVRTADHNLEAFVVDGKKVVLSLSDLSEEKTGYHFTIWPENEHLAEALGHYFNKVWEKARTD